MINEKELRIGNWVKQKGVEIKIHGAYAIYAIEQNPELFKPIPLTEERLIKFGLIGIQVSLVGDKSWDFWDSSPFSIERYNGRWAVNVPQWGYIIDNLEYVHQLQNLYFALAGKEL